MYLTAPISVADQAALIMVQGDSSKSAPVRTMLGACAHHFCPWINIHDIMTQGMWMRVHPCRRFVTWPSTSPRMVSLILLHLIFTILTALIYINCTRVDESYSLLSCDPVRFHTYWTNFLATFVYVLWRLVDSILACQRDRPMGNAVPMYTYTNYVHGKHGSMCIVASMYAVLHGKLEWK